MSVASDPLSRDWLEETEFEIELKHLQGLLETTAAKISFTMGLGSKTPIAGVEFTLQRLAGTPQKIKPLPLVDDTFASYTFSYTVTADNKDIYDSPQFTVWPKSINITAKYKKMSGDVSTYNDGDPVKDFPFKLTQAGKGVPPTAGPFKTVDGGVRIAPVVSLGEVIIIPESPWEIVDPTDQRGSKRKREIKVQLKPWKAKIHSPVGGKAQDTPLKRYVNIPKDYKCGTSTKDYSPVAGSLMKIEVGPETLSDGKKDQEIKVRVTFPATNSKRSKPFPGVWLTEAEGTALKPNPDTALPGKDELKYETFVKLPADGKPAVFYVQTGVAGGDKCKIEVGVTNTYEDDVMHVENWRILGLELMIADAAFRQKCSLILADTGAALSDPLKAELIRIFDKTFIEFLFPDNAAVTLRQTDFVKYWKCDGTSGTFARTLKPEHLFVARTKLKLLKYNEQTKANDKVSLSDGGDKVFLCPPNHESYLRIQKLVMVPKPKNHMTWTFADFIAERAATYTLTPITTKSDLSKVTNFSGVDMEKVAEKEMELPFHIFEHDPIEANGEPGVITVCWRTTDFKKTTDSTWTPITRDDDPGGAKKGYNFIFHKYSPDELKEWYEIVDSVTLKVKLPAEVAKFLKAKKIVTKQDGGTEEIEFDVRINVSFTFYGVEFTTLGLASRGTGMLRCAGRSMLGMAQTLAHEIGHNCGQTYIQQATSGDLGWKGTAIEGLPFPSAFATGQYYVEKGHTGNHCAKGLWDVLKSQGADAIEKAAVSGSKFTSPSSEHQTKFFDKVEDAKQCIMYGSRKADATVAVDFCDSCKEFLRAMDLSDVSISW